MLHALRGDALVHLHELGPVAGEEGNLKLPGEGLGEHRLSSSRGAIEEHTPRGLDAGLGEGHVAHQHLHDLRDCGLDVIHARHVIKVHPGALGLPALSLDVKGLGEGLPEVVLLLPHLLLLPLLVAVPQREQELHNQQRTEGLGDPAHPSHGHPVVIRLVHYELKVALVGDQPRVLGDLAVLAPPGQVGLAQLQKPVVPPQVAGQRAVEPVLFHGPLWGLPAVDHLRLDGRHALDGLLVREVVRAVGHRDLHDGVAALVQDGQPLHPALGQELQKPGVGHRSVPDGRDAVLRVELVLNMEPADAARRLLPLFELLLENLKLLPAPAKKLPNGAVSLHLRGRVPALLVVEVPDVG
mmetsp:Transcript_2175/g.7877  ORF Transcript_2175/g.7877 Transcript_2175/m.7877 type:complete len:354 (-) Transcript_2175:334-1395(-)